MISMGIEFLVFVLNEDLVHDIEICKILISCLLVEKNISIGNYA